MQILGLSMYTNNICRFVTMVHYYNITSLDFIYRPVFYLKLYVSETGFCLRLQMKPTHIGFNRKS
jgi:hypothetical protein